MRVGDGPEELATALRRLLSDRALRTALGAQGPARARALCTPATQVGRLGEISRTPAPQRGAPDERRSSRRASAPASPRGTAPTRCTPGWSSGSPSAGRSSASPTSAAEAVRSSPGSTASATRYLGCDAVRYPEFPDAPGAEFVESDLNRLPLPLAAGSCDAVVAVETIEHLENPRAFVRELARLCRPGGTVLVTTPNQLSLFAKLHLVLRGQFPAFVDAPGLYPTHITPLLEQDLVRIFREAGLERPEVRYTDQGRIPLTARHWPTGLRGAPFSDNLLIAARKPGPAAMRAAPRAPRRPGVSAGRSGPAPAQSPSREGPAPAAAGRLRARADGAPAAARARRARPAAHARRASPRSGSASPTWWSSKAPSAGTRRGR